MHRPTDVTTAIITAGDLERGQRFLLVLNTIKGPSVGGYVRTVIEPGLYREGRQRFTMAADQQVVLTEEPAGRWVPYRAIELREARASASGATSSARSTATTVGSERER